MNGHVPGYSPGMQQPSFSHVPQHPASAFQHQGMLSGPMQGLLSGQMQQPLPPTHLPFQQQPGGLPVPGQGSHLQSMGQPPPFQNGMGSMPGQLGHMPPQMLPQQQQMQYLAYMQAMQQQQQHMLHQQQQQPQPQPQQQLYGGSMQSKPGTELFRAASQLEPAVPGSGWASQVWRVDVYMLQAALEVWEALARWTRLAVAALPGSRVLGLQHPKTLPLTLWGCVVLLVCGHLASSAAGCAQSSLGLFPPCKLSLSTPKPKRCVELQDHLSTLRPK